VPQDCAESQLFDVEYEKQIFAWAAAKIEPSFQPNTWQAFWQTAVEHRPVSEVAESLQLSAGAIYMARSRVIARLRKTIELATDMDFSGDKASLTERSDS